MNAMENLHMLILFTHFSLTMWVCDSGSFQILDANEARVSYVEDNWNKDNTVERSSATCLH